LLLLVLHKVLMTTSTIVIEILYITFLMELRV
jgi:hypothetical protein